MSASEAAGEVPESWAGSGFAAPRLGEPRWRDPEPPPRVLPSGPPAIPAPARPRRSALAEAERLRRGLGAILVMVALGGCTAGASAVVVQADLAVQASSAHVAALRDNVRQLRLQAAQLANPQVIAQEAVDEYGMRPPAGYVPVGLRPVPAAAVPAPAHSAEGLLPLPAGPAPGGAVALGEGLGRWAGGAWRRVASLVRGGHARG